MKNNENKAFTLAEILITLTILGVVAAISIPNIINGYRERATVTRVKKMYSTLNSAYTSALAYNQVKEGELFGYTKEGAEAIAEIFKPYLAISMDCGTSKNAAAGKPGKVKCGLYDGRYKTIKNEDTTYYADNTKYYAFKLKDGSVIWLRGYDESHTASFWYDVNGNKGPNTFGKDVFHFVANGKDMRAFGDTESAFNSRCNKESNELNRGLGCTGWVVYKGNMDYLRCKDELTWNMNKCP